MKGLSLQGGQETTPVREKHEVLVTKDYSVTATFEPK